MGAHQIYSLVFPKSMFGFAYLATPTTARRGGLLLGGLFEGDKAVRRDAYTCVAEGYRRLMGLVDQVVRHLLKGCGSSEMSRDVGIGDCGRPES